MAPSTNRSNRSTRLGSPSVISDTVSDAAAFTVGRPTPSSSSSSTKAPADNGKDATAWTSLRDKLDAEFERDVRAKVQSIPRNGMTVAAAAWSDKESESTPSSSSSTRTTATDKGKGSNAKARSKAEASAAFKRDVQAKTRMSSQEDKSDEYEALREHAERVYTKASDIADRSFDRMRQLSDEGRRDSKEFHRCEIEWHTHTKIVHQILEYYLEASRGSGDEKSDAGSQASTAAAVDSSDDEASDAGSQSAASDAEIKVIAKVAVDPRGEAVLRHLLRGLRGMDDPVDARFTAKALLNAVQAADPGAHFFEFRIGDPHGESEVVARAAVGRRGDAVLRRMLPGRRSAHFALKQLFHAVQAADPAPQIIGIGIKDSPARGGKSRESKLDRGRDDRAAFYWAPFPRPRGDTYNDGVSDRKVATPGFYGNPHYPQTGEGKRAWRDDYRKWLAAGRRYSYYAGSAYDPFCW